MHKQKMFLKKGQDCSSPSLEVRVQCIWSMMHYHAWCIPKLTSIKNLSSMTSNGRAAISMILGTGLNDQELQHYLSSYQVRWMQEKLKINETYFENQLNTLHWDADGFFFHLIQCRQISHWLMPGSPWSNTELNFS